MKKIILAFIILSLVQLYVPASMIMKREKIINDGAKYLFETAPIDPRDPFRGQYIWLNFKENSYVPADASKFSHGEQVYILLEKNTEGVANIHGISQSEPLQGDFLKVNISHINNDRIYFDLPFTRFYMQENKAPQAEAFIQETAENRGPAYAVVYIYNGESVLQDVTLNNQSLKEIIK
jgi:uncharacterized membrane-anchored protein